MDHDNCKKTGCRYSGEPLGKPFLDLGTMPLANNYIAPGDKDQGEFECPLSLVWAPESGLVQLSHVVPPQKMFDHYLYVSSTTQTFRDHFAGYARSVKEKLSSVENPLAVDIGSNDGLLVGCYEREGMRGVGIDPAKNLAEEANKKGLRTINRYFDEACVEEILEEFGPAHAISANNVFAHIDDIHAVLRNVKALLHDEGFFVIEFPYLVTMVEEMLFDMIYHEHLSYIGVTALDYVMKKFGMSIFHIDQVSSHGGSLRVFVQKAGGPQAVSSIVADLMQKEEKDGYLSGEIYECFAERVYRVKEEFRALIGQLRSEGKRIAGYGAPAKCSTLLNFYELGPKEFEYVVDDNPLKQGLLIPGAHVPVKSSSALSDEPVDVIVIFAWNFAREIMKKLEPFSRKGIRFLIPLARDFSGKLEFELQPANV